MIIITSVKELSSYILPIKHNKSIGFVPTMGALHQGHISLLKESKENCDITICSIFVNPTQFNNKNDLENYPRFIEEDIKLLIHNDCDILFYPLVDEMYPEGLTKNTEDYGKIVTVFEGLHRPGHFDGVIIIVSRLFDIVKPTHAFFGQKDYQQCMVVAELIKRKSFDITLIICPILREADGLAMSSRNVRLNPHDRIHAAQIYQGLNHIKKHLKQNNFIDIIEEAKQIIESNSDNKTEYLAIVNADTLENNYKDGDKLVAMVAVNTNNVRLIDNIII